MITAFIKYIEKYVNLDQEEVNALKASVPVKTFKKGTTLLKEGMVSNMSYFNINGCVRMYLLVDGEEKTTFFYNENQFIVSFNSFSKQQAADHYLECVEDSSLALLSFEAERALLKRFPKFEHLSRVLLEEALGAYQEMLASYIIANPEDRYRNLLKKNPDLINRIPQYHLATYLGVKPESLSRIRKRILGKNKKLS